MQSAMNSAPTAADKDPYLISCPIRVGILLDMPDYVALPALSIFEVVRDQYRKSGRIGRDVEFLVKRPLGAPGGYIKNVSDAYHELCDEGALLVVGPGHSDSNHAMIEHAEARRVPLLTLGATANNVSPHVFNMAWGFIPADAALCANWLAAQGCKRVTVTYDRAHHAAEYVDVFKSVVERYGMEILAIKRLPVLVADADAINRACAETVVAHRALKPDGIVHFATGPSATPWARAVNNAAWDVPRIMNDAFTMAYNPDHAPAYEGWVGTLLWDDENLILKRFVEEYKAFHPGKPLPIMEQMALHRDAMNVALEGLAQTSVLTPEGVKAGLERIHMLPAATGGPRTILSLSPMDHRAHKGADVMILRRMKAGKLIMEGRFDPTLDKGC